MFLHKLLCNSGSISEFGTDYLLLILLLLWIVSCVPVFTARMKARPVFATMLALNIRTQKSCKTKPCALHS
jgi:hypothetical protein